MGPSFSMASCGLVRKPGTRYVVRPSLATARSICCVASSTLGRPGSFGFWRASPGQKRAIFGWAALFMASLDLLAASRGAVLGVEPRPQHDLLRRRLAAQDLQRH